MKRLLRVLAGALCGAIACAKFGAEEGTSLEAGVDASTDADASPPDASSDAHAPYCATRGKGGALLGFCDDFDEGQVLGADWTQSLLGAAAGASLSIRPEDALSPPGSIFTRIGPDNASTTAHAVIRHTITVPPEAKSVRYGFDVRLSALPAIGASGYVLLGNLVVHGAICDGGARAREVRLVLLTKNAQLGILGYGSTCGGDDTQGANAVPVLTSAALAGNIWHRVAIAIDRTPCDAVGGPGSIRMTVDGASACITAASDPVPAAQTVDFEVGLSTANFTRTLETSAFFDNATLDLD